MDTPVVFQYQQALDEFRREGREPPLLKRMSELISLLDLTTTLGSSLSRDEILSAALLIVMGEMQAYRGALLVQVEDRRFAFRAARGLKAPLPAELVVAEMGDAVVLRDAKDFPAAFAELELEVACPILRSGRAIAILALGRRADGRAYGDEDAGFLRSVAACAATPIENGLMYHQLQRANQGLSLRIFQLRNLFDISRELVASFDEETIKNLVTTTLMGHLMVSRIALYLRVPGGLGLAHARGVKADQLPALIPEKESRGVLERLSHACAAADIPEGTLRSGLQRGKLTVVVPVSVGGPAEGLIATGERASGLPFGEEDRDFAYTLGRQALAALESVRAQKMRLEKQRRDRELQIAREIQQSLFPKSCPDVAGFDLAADSRPCYEVGGDHYDIIPLPGGRLGIAVADVSGKGTPASILMASVHATLRALAGSVPAGALIQRLNTFLCESTQANKYVTLFYAELDPAARRLVYVNAGHVPPYHVSGAGERRRLTLGGPVLGLIEAAEFETGEVALAPGDVVATVTDGATEAQSPSEEEFGDDRIFGALEAARGRGARDILAALVGAVEAWTGSAGCSDDLTSLVVKAKER